MWNSWKKPLILRQNAKGIKQCHATYVIRIFLVWFDTTTIFNLLILEGLALYGGQTSSSCGGLVAFGPKGPHLVAEGSPSDTLKILWRPDLIGQRYIGSKMFICLFVCLFVYRFVCFFFVLIFVGHQQKVPLKILWRFDLIWLRYLGSKNVYLFVCLFVCLLTCFFILIILGHPQKYTLKISWRSDLIWLRY